MMSKFLESFVNTLIWIGVFAVILILVYKIDTGIINKDSRYNYAIIFYPDSKTSVEGYIDKFTWGSSIVRVTIDGEEYIVSPENVVIIKRKDLVVNKEVDE